MEHNLQLLIKRLTSTMEKQTYFQCHWECHLLCLFLSDETGIKKKKSREMRPDTAKSLVKCSPPTGLDSFIPAQCAAPS